MTFQTIRRPGFTRTERGRRFPIDELDSITLASDAVTDDDERVPAGTTGTVVAVWGQAEAFDLEFDAPYTGIATVRSDQLRNHRLR